MSVAVEIEKLVEVAAGFGTVPMLLTTDASGRPRASAVTIVWDGALARVRAGHRSVTNAAERPLVSLLYPAPPQGRYALLIDCEVDDVVHDETPGDPASQAEAPPDPAPGAPAPRARAKPGGYVVVRATSGILHVVNRPHP